MVYLATQESLQRPVALKVLNPLHSDTPEFTERFLNEGRVLASLVHSNIITIHDIGVADGVHYIAMEYVEGGDLKQRMRKGLVIPEALGHVEAVARALDYAHRKGIVHRDVKPANVMFRSDGTLVLTDFGIAKQLGGNSDLTITGSTIGSPHYLSPEQAQGKQVDARADIYSIGIMLFETLTGSKPYRGESDIETVLKHLTHPPPKLPPELVEVQPLLDRVLAKNVDERIDSAEEVAQELRKVRKGWSGPMEVTPLRLEVPEPETAISVDQDAETAAHPTGSSLGSWLKLVMVGALTGAVILVGLLFAGRMYLDDLLGGEGALATISPRPDGRPADTPAPAPAPSSALAAAVRQPAARDPVATAGSAAQAAPEPEPDVPLGREALAAVESPGIPEQRAQATTRSRSAASAGGAEPEEARIAALLESADEAIEELRLTRPEGNSAIDFIAQVLELDPGNQAARASFKRIAGRYAVLARNGMGKGDFVKARLYVDRGLEVDATNADLKALDAELDERSANPPARGQQGASEPAPAIVGPVNDSAALDEGQSPVSGTVHQGESPSELFSRIKGLFDKD